MSRIPLFLSVYCNIQNTFVTRQVYVAIINILKVSIKIVKLKFENELTFQRRPIVVLQEFKEQIVLQFKYLAMIVSIPG